MHMQKLGGSGGMLPMASEANFGPKTSLLILALVQVNPQRACAARVTVLGLCVCVCVCVCFSENASL